MPEVVSLLSRAEILEADDIEYENLPVPEWGGTVRVRGLTGFERDAYEASMSQQRGKSYVRNMANVRAKLVARTVIDQDGNRLFDDKDTAALGKKSASALDRVFEVAARLSRLSDEDVEELAGKSDSGLSDDSTSS